MLKKQLTKIKESIEKNIHDLSDTISDLKGDEEIDLNELLTNSKIFYKGTLLKARDKKTILTVLDGLTIN